MKIEKCLKLGFDPWGNLAGRFKSFLHKKTYGGPSKNRTGQLRFVP
jgi:hypothetical protein